MNKPNEYRSITLHDLEPNLEDFQDAVIFGLTQDKKQLPCKFFYDQAGSKIFDQICELDEYYPTRTEIAILQSCAEEIAKLAGEKPLLVEYGSGSSVKVRTLIDSLNPAAYVPIDISRDHLVESAENFASDYPEMEVIAVCADYSDDFLLPQLVTEDYNRKVAFFPGSSLGNFTPDQGLKFLKRVSSQLSVEDTFVIGLDLIKDRAVLHAAYNDEKGVTAAFNLNLLARINKELDGNFDLDQFVHKAHYNEAHDRIEMHIESLTEQQVQVGETEFAFKSGETIHTENSHKYDIADFQKMAKSAGFQPVKVWTDERDWFSVHLLQKT